MMKKVFLHKGKEQSLLRFHPWVFSGAIRKIDESIIDGDRVEVIDAANRTIGFGHFQHGSIAVRMLHFGKGNFPEHFWVQKMNAAYQYRKQIPGLQQENTNAFRLVFGEGDGLPGLILDYYDGHVVFQAHSIGMHNERHVIKEALLEVFGNQLKSLYDKSKETLPKNFAATVENGYLHGDAADAVIKENGHLFRIDWLRGQKTGFFLDQRENRALLKTYSAGKTVLNTFCYTGGFSVYAAAGNAIRVDSVDVSKQAMELTDINVQLNGLQNHRSFCADTFDFLKEKENEYDVIVLDPPAFAKSRDVKHNAVIGYKRLNAAAIRQIKPGGILFTFSCSQVIDKYLFTNTVTAAAIEAGRNIRIIEQLSQPADHPINIFHPEGEYLKGLILHVE